MPTRLSGPQTPLPPTQVPKGQGCACSGRFPLSPRESRGLLGRWAQKSPRRTPAARDAVPRDACLFVFFPEESSCTLCFPFLVPLESRVMVSCRGEPSWLEGLPQAGGWTGGGEQVATVGHSWQFRLARACSSCCSALFLRGPVSLLGEPFLALSSVSLRYLRLGVGGAHLVAAALPCCVRCPSHSARGIEHLCYSNY